MKINPGTDFCGIQPALLGDVRWTLEYYKPAWAAGLMRPNSF